MLGGVLTDLSYLTSQFDVSRGGALVYAPATGQPPAASIVWVSAGGQIETLFDDARIEFPRLSGDGRHVVYASTQATREKDLWTWDVVARRRSRLTNVRGEEYSPAVSHDGRIVIFAAWREKWGIYRTSTLAAAEVPLAVPATRAIRAWSISADGRWLAVTDDVPGGAFDRLGADIGVVDLDSKTQEPRWLTATSFREDQPSFSPDGTRLAFVSNQLGRADIWVRRVAEADAGQAMPVSRDGGMTPLWSSDGRTLYYTAGTALMAAALSADGRFAEPRKVLDLPNLSVVGVAPDGRFLAERRTREPVTRLEIILNWLQAIDQRSGS
jgi:Tol biopolymer transport system component